MQPFPRSETHSAVWWALSLATVAVAVLGVYWVEALNSAPQRTFTDWLVVAFAAATIAIAVVIGVGLERTRRMGLMVLIAGQLFWFAIPGALTALDPDVTFEDRVDYALTDADVRGALLRIAAFTVLSLATYFVFAPRVPPPRTPPAAPERGLTRGRFLVVVGGLVAVGLLPFAIYGENLQGVLDGILGSRSATEKAWIHAAFTSKPINVIGRAALVTAGALSFTQALRTAGLRRAAWGGLFLLCFLITYFDSGTRSWTGLIVVPPILVALHEQLATGKALRWLLIGPIIVTAVLWAAQLQLAFRNQGISTEVIESQTEYTMEDNDFFIETAIAVNLVPDRIDYVREWTTWLFISNPIPRSIWPSKPYPELIRQYSYGRRGYDEYVDAGSSSLPSIVGQYHMNWGWWGIFIVSVFFGSVLAFTDRIWTRGDASPMQLIWAAATAIWLFLSFRGVWPGFHYPVFILALLVWIERRSARSGATKPT